MSGPGREFPHAQNSPVWLFRDFTAAHRMANDALMNKMSVREVGQPLILFVLEHSSDSGTVSTQKQLADTLRVSPATIATSLKSLVNLGLVSKVSDERDMRCNRIEITPAGRTVAAKFRDMFDRIDAAMYAGFSEEEMKIVESVFHRMTENLIAFAADVKEENG